jgi:hypothetical protein
MTVIMIIILGGAVLMGLTLVAVLAVVGIVTRRPGIVAVAGLVCLLGIGLVLSLFVGVRTSSSTRIQYNGTEIMPQAVNVYPHDTSTHEVTMQMPQGMHVRTTWSFMILPVFLLGVLAVTGILALVVRASRSSSGERRSVWPTIVAIPVIGLLLVVFVGYLKLRAVQKFSAPPAFEQLPQDISVIDAPAINSEFAAAHQQMMDQTRAQVQHAAEAKQHIVMAAAEAKRSHELAVASVQRQHEAQIQEQLRQQAIQKVAILNAELQHQLATMDINELIEVFTAPKINLGPVLVEVASNVAEPRAAAEAPIVAAPVVEAKTIEVPPVVVPPVPAAAPAAPAAPAPVVVAAATAAADGMSTQAAAAVASGAVEEAVQAEAKNNESNPLAAPKEVKAVSEKAPADEASVEKTVAPVVVKTSPEETVAPPAWIHDKPGTVGQDYREIVSTDEYATEDEARRAMDVLLMLRTAERVRSLTGEDSLEQRRPSLTFHQGTVTLDGTVAYDPNYRQWWDQDIRLLNSMGIGMNEIRRSVVRDQYMASRESSRALNTMYKQYTQAQFTPWFDDQLKKHWLAYKRQDRFEQVSMGATSVIGLLAFVFGLFKVDTWTKGYYTKRLFIGVPAMIIGGSMVLAFISSMM